MPEAIALFETRAGSWRGFNSPRMTHVRVQGRIYGRVSRRALTRCVLSICHRCLRRVVSPRPSSRISSEAEKQQEAATRGSTLAAHPRGNP